MLISPRNSVEAVLHLVHSNEASLLIIGDDCDQQYATALSSAIPAGRGSLAVVTIEMSIDTNPDDNSVPDWDGLLRNTESEASEAALREEARKPAMFLHTSGSTGSLIPASYETHRRIS